MDDTEQILAKYEPYIKKVAWSLTTHYPSIREDVEQEMRIAVLDHAGKPVALVNRIIHCRAIDFLRRYTKYDSHRNENVKKLSYEQIADWGYIYSEPSCESQIVDDIFIEQILSSLPVGRRHVMEEFYLRERELKDIGHDRGISEARACQLKREEIARLRRMFGDDFS